MGRRPPTTSEAVLMANVGRRFYLHGESKQDIADVLGISRFRVARLLERAREESIVRIQVGLPGEQDADLGLEIAERYGLEHAVVLDVGTEDVRALIHRLGRAAVQLLGELVDSSDVLGLASARPLLGISDDIDAFPACTVMQLTGATSRPDALDIIQSIRSMTRVGGGEAYVYYAPIVNSVPTADVRRNADVAAAWALIPRLTAVVLGIGVWAPGLSTVHDMLSEADRRATADAGVTTEVAGLYLDADGRPLQPPVVRYTLAPSFDELRRVPRRIGIGFGDDKAPGMHAALVGGLANSLITHRSAAEALLSIPLPNRSTSEV